MYILSIPLYHPKDKREVLTSAFGFLSGKIVVWIHHTGCSDLTEDETGWRKKLFCTQFHADLRCLSLWTDCNMRLDQQITYFCGWCVGAF